MVPQGRLRIVKTSRGVRNCGRSEHRRGSISKTRTVLMGCCEGLARWASPSWCLRHGATRASVPFSLWPALHAVQTGCPGAVLLARRPRSRCLSGRAVSRGAVPLAAVPLVECGRGAPGRGGDARRASAGGMATSRTHHAGVVATSRTALDPLLATSRTCHVRPVTTSRPLRQRRTREHSSDLRIRREVPV